MMNNKMIDLIQTYGIDTFIREFLNTLYDYNPNEWKTNLEAVKEAISNYSDFPTVKDVGKYFKSGNKYFKVLSAAPDEFPKLFLFEDDINKFSGMTKSVMDINMRKEIEETGVEEITELMFHIAYDKAFKYIPRL